MPRLDRRVDVVRQQDRYHRLYKYRRPQEPKKAVEQPKVNILQMLNSAAKPDGADQAKHSQGLQVDGGVR